MFRMRESHGDTGTRLIRKDLHKVSAQISAYSPEKRLLFFDDMTDLFGEFNSFEYIEQVFEEIIETNDDREFQLLTKRIGRAMVFYRKKGYVPRNVWQGCSIGEKSRLRRLDQLREIGAKVRFVSFEPLIEDLGDFDLRGIHWAIVGGESGRNPRPREMRPEWAENIRRICQRDGVHFFYKQSGGYGGDGAGGDLLNGKQYHEFPDY